MKMMNVNCFSKFLLLIYSCVLTQVPAAAYNEMKFGDSFKTGDHAKIFQLGGKTGYGPCFPTEDAPRTIRSSDEGWIQTIDSFLCMGTADSTLEYTPCKMAFRSPTRPSALEFLSTECRLEGIWYEAKVAGDVLVKANNGEIQSWILAVPYVGAVAHGKLGSASLAPLNNGAIKDGVLKDDRIGPITVYFQARMDWPRAYLVLEPEQMSAIDAELSPEDRQKIRAALSTRSSSEAKPSKNRNQEAKQAKPK